MKWMDKEAKCVHDTGGKEATRLSSKEWKRKADVFGSSLNVWKIRPNCLSQIAGNVNYCLLICSLFLEKHKNDMCRNICQTLSFNEWKQKEKLDMDEDNVKSPDIIKSRKAEKHLRHQPAMERVWDRGSLSIHGWMSL